MRGLSVVYPLVLSLFFCLENGRAVIEFGVPQLEISYPTLGGGTRQHFKSTVLGWNHAQGVFEIPAGQEMLKLEEKVALLTAQIAIFKTSAADPLAEQCKQFLKNAKSLVNQL